MARRQARDHLIAGRPRNQSLRWRICPRPEPDGPAPGFVATLAASESAANGAHPPGWVQFQADDTTIGSPVAVSAAGAYLASATTIAAQAAGGSVGNGGSITITVTAITYMEAAPLPASTEKTLLPQNR
jgi:hypothetical protein